MAVESGDGSGGLIVLGIALRPPPDVGPSISHWMSYCQELM